MRNSPLVARRAAVLTAATATSLAVVVGLPPTPAAAALPAGCVGGDQSVTCTYTVAGAASFTVPAFVTSVDITAIGGHGAAAPAPSGYPAAAGGAGEQAQATFPVSASDSIHPGDVLSLTVAENASGSTGGAPGGGDGGAANTTGTAAGGGGGATSVINNRANPDATLIIAGGGGGGGGSGVRDFPAEAGGAGGTGGASGAAGAGADGSGSFPGGGGAGATSLPGAGGAAGTDPTPPVDEYHAGQAGSAGTDGTGGAGAQTDAYGGSGGGGGGGFAGGGGGGSGASVHVMGSVGAESDGGGGGGQGSTFISGTATTSSASVGGSTPEVMISYAKQADVVSFTSTPPAPGVVNSMYHLTATGGGSTAPVVFSSATPDICSVSGDVATFLAIGDCVINADQAADDTYAKATTATQHVTVVGAEQSLTFDTTPPAHAVVGGHYVVRAIGGESGNPVVFSSGSTRICSVSGATVTFTAVGTCVVVAQQAGDSMYAPAFATQRIPVGKRTEHPTLRLASPKRGVLKAKVTANPRLRGLLVRLYVHTHHHDKKIGSAHTNRHGVAVLKHRETPGKVLHIRARLAASATTKSAQTAIKTVTIKT